MAHEPEGSSKLYYLTVQDVLWINLQVTKRQQPFSYAKLEEATFYQYGYGASTNLVAQAAKFLVGFMKQAPLAEGNDATAFVGCESFLRLNGFAMNIPDDEASSWVQRVKSGQINADEAVSSLAKPVEAEHGVPSVKASVGEVFEQYRQTVDRLAATKASA